MKPLESVHEHGSVDLFQDVLPDVHGVVGADCKEVPVEGRVVQLAEREPVRNARLTADLGVGDDVRRVQKLVVPRLLAATVGLPMLALFANLLGILGGLLIATQSGIGATFYYQSVVGVVTVADFWSGLVKTVFFGALIAAIACHRGLRTTGGTVGVGRATTQSVVAGSIAVFVSDFFLTKVILLW